MAQMLTVALTTLPGNKGKVTHAISHIVKFKREIHPGQKLIIKTELTLGPEDCARVEEKVSLIM